MRADGGGQARAAEAARRALVALVLGVGVSFRTPLEPPGGQCLGTVQAGPGDRLALALGESSEGEQPSFLAVAYVDRVHSDQYPIPDGMAITDAGVARLAHLPASRLPALIVGGLIAGAALLAVHARPVVARRQPGSDR